MASPRYGLSDKQLTLAVKNLCRLIGVMKQVDPRIGDFTPSLEGFLAGNQDLVLDLPRTGIAVNKTFASHTVVSVPGTRRFTADFYRNATSHLFLPAAILAASELYDGNISLEQSEIFRKCLQREYLCWKTLRDCGLELRKAVFQLSFCT